MGEITKGGLGGALGAPPSAEGAPGGGKTGKKRPHPLPDRREGMGLFHFLDQLGQQLLSRRREPVSVRRRTGSVSSAAKNSSGVTPR